MVQEQGEQRKGSREGFVSSPAAAVTRACRGGIVALLRRRRGGAEAVQRRRGGGAEAAHLLLCRRRLQLPRLGWGWWRWRRRWAASTVLLARCHHPAHLAAALREATLQLPRVGDRHRLPSKAPSEGGAGRVQTWQRVSGWAGAGAGARAGAGRWRARGAGEERAVRGRRYPRLKERMEALTVRPRGVRVRGLRAEGSEADGGERGDEPGWGEGEAAAAVRGRGSARMCSRSRPCAVRTAAVCA